ncbi:MAG: tRNA pseudouridine(38-40) synthase TruA, partial [Candidatus Glassbacteria bacterium]|nr:tRNA pseudouridine(38-40) synthase TruA [Candidatus Glassbacteria bacterium]
MPEMENQAESKTGGRRIRLTVAYDGTGYLGWQYQPNGPTVQGELENALSSLQAGQGRVIGAGRTDAGVHALGQVAHFDTDSRLDCRVLERALNSLLPRDIRVREVMETGPAFHARYSASARCYRYSLADQGLPESVLLRRTCWVRQTALPGRELLDRCAGLLVGKHDFFT